MENSVIQMITEFQVRKGVSFRSFSETIGFNHSTLNNYTIGRKTSIDIELLKKIAPSYDYGNIDIIDNSEIAKDKIWSIMTIKAKLSFENLSSYGSIIKKTIN